MTDDSQEIRSKLAALREMYARSLPDRLAEIEDTWKQLRQHFDAQLLATLHRQVHTLIGSGGTFGYTELAERARPLEQRIKQVMQQGGPAPHLYAHIDRLVQYVVEAGKAAVVMVEREPLEERSGGVASTSVRSRSILLVDDAGDYAADLALQLGYYGFKVNVLTELGRLKQTVAELRPDALVMDVVFPDGDLAGPESVSQLRQHTTHVPATVFISNRRDQAARLAAVRAGAAAYFTKPLDVAAVADKLDVLLSPQDQQPYRILIVDDDTSVAEHNALVLRRAGMEVSIVSNPALVLEALEQCRPELILMDLYMPDCTGLELSQLIRQQDIFVGVPIVFLSVEKDIEQHLAAISLGGDDFLMKPVRAGHLVTAVRARVSRARIIQSFMVRDSLTGLLNHSAINDRLIQEVAQIERYGGRLSYALLDLDYFKQINDRYGHPVGDHVLRSLSRLLRHRVRESDTVGRYGGEEFVIILPGADEARACALLNAIRTAFSSIHQHAAEGTFNATLSAGVASYKEGQTAAMLTKAADEALYRAKTGGRDRIVGASQP